MFAIIIVHTTTGTTNTYDNQIIVITSTYSQLIVNKKYGHGIERNKNHYFG